METVTVKEYIGDIAVLGTDKDVIAVFHPGTKHNPIKSLELGSPFFDPVDYLKVIHPGEPLNVYDQPVREQDKWRFKAQWDRYIAGKTQEVAGTPIAVLFPYQPEVVHSLSAMHITTVQQLADLSDTAKMNIMFGLNLSQKAKDYLTHAEKAAGYHQLQAKLDTQKEQIAELVATVNELRNKLTAAPVKRRGRPPRVHSETHEEAAAL